MRVLGEIFWKLWPGGKPQDLDFSLDGRVLFFTLGLSLLATMLFGLVPALQATKPEQMTRLRDRTDGPSGSSRWYGLRGMLVAARSLSSDRACQFGLVHPQLAQCAADQPWI